METGWLIIIVLGGFLLLLMLGAPVAFAFILVNMIGIYFFWGGDAGLRLLISNMYSSIASFILLPVVLFILMGEVMFHSGVVTLMIETLDKWVGRLPGRLSLLAVAVGTIFATLSGSSTAGVAVLGSTLVPEMQKRGYSKSMSLGPILGAGGLAMMIPPSALAAFWGAVAQVSIGKLLIAITIPGFLLAVVYATYIIVRCLLKPSIAPAYEVAPMPFSDRLWASVKYILPLLGVIFLVTGVIFLGIATPTEASALGAFGAFILAAVYRKFDWALVKKSFVTATTVTVMALVIMMGSSVFGQVLAYSGATRTLAELAVSLPVAPILTVIAMQAVLLMMGMFMDTFSMIMVTIPIFMPMIKALQFDPVWFGVVFLINMEAAMITPPYGFSLIVLKGVSPPDIKMGDIIKAGLPFVGLEVLVMALVMIFPILALWLPALMQ